jgi:hypothetical protein
MNVAIRRIRLSVALIALLAPAAAECQSDPALWRFVYPNAKALISINWQRIRQSPAGAMIRDKWLGAGPMAAIPGIELLDEIDRVLISSPGNETTTGTAVVAAEAPVLIAVNGHFDTARVRQLFTRLGAKPQAYNSFQVYRPQGVDAKDMAYVLVDPGTILFGDAPSLFAALDRNQFAPPAPAAGSIIARGAEMDSVYEMWLVITTPDIVAKDRLVDLFRGGEWAPDAQGFEAGVNLRAGLAADVTVRFASAVAAKRVVTEMTRLTTVMSKAKGSKDKTAVSPMLAIVKKLKFTSDGSAAKISLRLTPQELETSAQALAAHQAPAASANGFASAAGASRIPAQAAVSSPGLSQPAPATPGVIRIEGLDGGPREIPYPDQQH